MPIIEEEFYQQSDILSIAQELLGKVLLTNFEGDLTSGIIVETEAYEGLTDKASHAYGGKKTNRTKTMYESGGVAYVYLCYGMHHLFNIVTNKVNIPHAILIRAVEPLDGLSIMLKRRNKNNKDLKLTSGPGSMTKALGITMSNSGESLMNQIIWLEDQNIKIKKKNIISSPRVGIPYAEEDISNPWRFRIQNNPWTSSPN